MNLGMQALKGTVHPTCTFHLLHEFIKEKCFDNKFEN